MLKEIYFSKNQDDYVIINCASSNSTDKVVCRRNVYRLSYRSTKCCVDENFSTIIRRPTACR